MASSELDAALIITAPDFSGSIDTLAYVQARPNLTLVEDPRPTHFRKAAGVLLATLDESAAWYTDIATELNGGRQKWQQFDVVPEDELADRANAWLTDERLKASTLYDGLVGNVDYPLMVLALPNTPISHEETVQTWADTRGGNLLRWSGRLAFLQQWSADELSGYDPRHSQEPVRFVVVETAYHREGRGDREIQAYNMEHMQVAHPLIGSATMFEGAVLARRYANDGTFNIWEKTVARAVDLKPDRENRVPLAFVNHKGEVVVGSSGYGYTHAARRRIK